MADFSGLQAEVTNLTSVVGSAVALINGIAAQIEAAVAANDAGDNTALASLATDVRAQADSLAEAVVAKTPAA
jgi:hypothetical protein